MKLCKIFIKYIWLIYFFCIYGLCFSLVQVRIKDVVTVEGIRENQLLGIGLVVGLAGQGDSSNSGLLKKTLNSFISSFGLTNQDSDIKSKNTAMVVVSADVPAFVRNGDRINITVSSIADAKSLEGGFLVQTPLKGANGITYAVAQGNLLTSNDSKANKNVAHIPDGAIIEQDIVSDFITNNTFNLILKHSDFITASEIKKAIEDNFPGIKITAEDPSRINIVIPEENQDNPVGFIAEIQKLNITPNKKAVVVIDSRSGVIVMGEEVKISSVSVSYKGLELKVGSQGQQTNQKKHFMLNDTATVGDVITLMNSTGVNVDFLIDILKAIDRSGALAGKLIII